MSADKVTVMRLVMTPEVLTSIVRLQRISNAESRLQVLQWALALFDYCLQERCKGNLAVLRGVFEDKVIPLTPEDGPNCIVGLNYSEGMTPDDYRRIYEAFGLKAEKGGAS